jgi:hypothetical protein
MSLFNAHVLLIGLLILFLAVVLLFLSIVFASVQHGYPYSVQPIRKSVKLTLWNFVKLLLLIVGWVVLSEFAEFAIEHLLPGIFDPIGEDQIQITIDVTGWIIFGLLFVILFYPVIKAFQDQEKHLPETDRISDKILDGRPSRGKMIFMT